MTLTSEHLATLQRPFALNDHEFLKDLVYITEGAITTRIEEVDPAWELTGLGITHRHTFGSDVQVTVIVRLTICGVSREGVGSAKVIGKTGTWEGKYPNKKFTPLPSEEHSEVNEAEKSAATDALKRAARLFGIGRYLLNLPDDVKDKESLARYFNQQPTTPPVQTPPKTAAASPKNNGSGKPRATTSEPAQTHFDAPSDPSAVNWWTDSAQVRRVRDAIGVAPGLAAGNMGRTFAEFGTADDFIAAYEERQRAL